MTTATPAEYGAAYLDEHHPGWADRIKLPLLDMGCNERCVLGQIYLLEGIAGGYDNGYSWAVVKHFPRPERLGFDLKHTHPHDPYITHNYAALTAEWSELVAARQTQTSPQEVLA
jgi:hypothetical protein